MWSRLLSNLLNSFLKHHFCLSKPQQCLNIVIGTFNVIDPLICNKHLQQQELYLGNYDVTVPPSFLHFFILKENTGNKQIA